MQFQRNDALIASIISGVNGVVRISITGTFEDVVVGQTITFQTDGYPLQSAQVLDVIDISTIEVDVLFDSGNATNGYINYHLNWFLEIRFVDSNATSDNQNATEIIADYSQVPSNLSGLVTANISVPADLIEPDFNLTGGLQSNLFIQYKIQYRQSYNGQRLLNWESPMNDIPILLVHATEDIEVGFTDIDISKRFYKGYPVSYCIIYSNINDAGNNDFSISLSQYGIDKNLITSDVYKTISNLNGVYNIVVDTNTFEAGTRFIEFTSQIATNNGQYAPTQYNPSQYA